MQVKYGVPSDNPERPDQVDGRNCYYQYAPYLYDTEDSTIISENKRYTMSDMKLEDRIESLEKYTTLSVLETKAANLFRRPTGQDRFKSGFFVDDLQHLNLKIIPFQSTTALTKVVTNCD